MFICVCFLYIYITKSLECPNWTDRTSADFNRKLNQYIYENLPLTAEQKMEFRSLFIVNADGDPAGIRASPSVDNE
jgi:hypothetical protein